MAQADSILITDIHGDHMATAIVDKLKRSGSGTEIVAPQAVSEKVFGSNVIAYGQTKKLGPFTVESVPSLQPDPGGPAAGK